MSVVSQPRRMPPATARASFQEHGYAVIEGLLGWSEVETLRDTAMQTIDALQQRDLTTFDRGSEGVIRASTCDLLSIPSLRHVLLDSRLLEAVETLLGGQPCYFGDSSLRVGKTGDRAWHRDNVDRVRWRGGPDWHNPYPVLRCGLYLQDQTHHSGGLALRPRSNLPQRRLPTLPRLVEARAGDLVAWDLRTVHSGEAVRMRGLPRLALNPRLQTCVPQSMRLPDDRERIVMFMTFGLAGTHIENFIAYCQTRDYMRTSWANSSFGQEVWAQARQVGLTVLHPTPEYGTPADSTSS